MGTEIVQSGRTRSQAWRERAGVLVVGAGIVSIIAVYLLLRASGARDNARDLLPYQALVASLPEADQRFFHALRRGLLEAEAERFRLAAWPDAAALTVRGVAPFAPAGDTEYQWSKLQQGTIVNYFGQPRNPAEPA